MDRIPVKKILLLVVLLLIWVGLWGVFVPKKLTKSDYDKAFDFCTKTHPTLDELYKSQQQLTKFEEEKLGDCDLLYHPPLVVNSFPDFADEQAKYIKEKYLDNK